MYIRYPYENNFIDIDSVMKFTDSEDTFSYDTKSVDDLFEPLKVTADAAAMQPPNSAPPSFVPNPKSSKSAPGANVKSVSPNSIRPCTFQNIYLWLTNGNQFWAWLTGVDNRTAYGFKWVGNRWVYFGVDLNKIDEFECFGYGPNNSNWWYQKNPRPRDFEKFEFKHINSSYKSDDSNYDDTKKNNNVMFVPLDETKSNTDTLKNNEKPTTNAPQSTPEKPNSDVLVKPEILCKCTHQHLYLWLANGAEFWSWLTKVNNDHVCGYRWKNDTWVYFSISIYKISCFKSFTRANIPNMKFSISSLNPYGRYLKDEIINPKDFTIIYPYFRSLLNKEIEVTDNKLIVDKYLELIRKQLFSIRPEEYVTVYGSYTLSLQTENIASFIFYLYSYGVNTSESISYESLNINYMTGEIYELKDLFNPKYNYLPRLKELALDYLKKQNSSAVANFKGFDNNQKFFLTDDGLVIYLNASDYDPSSLEILPIIIPYKDLEGMLYPGSPINQITSKNNTKTNPDKPIVKDNKLQFTNTDMFF